MGNWRCLYKAGLCLLVTGLAGCNGLQQGVRIRPVLDATDVRYASNNKALILDAFVVDAGFRPGEAVDWYLVSEAGFNYVDDQCRSYFDQLFFLDRGREQTKSGIAAAGQATSAILGITGASATSLAIVAQAFGLGVNATELLAGTYLYRLPPATTQGFVHKLQLAFRDAAAASKAQIDSPTAAYHMIQRYLDLCLPTRIEAEITKQISSATAIPVQQGGGALFSLETASTPSPNALRPLRIIGREVRTSTVTRVDKALPNRTRTPSEQNERDMEIASLLLRSTRAALCLDETGEISEATRAAIRTYLRARNLRVPDTIDPNAPLVRPQLQEAIVDVGDCRSQGFRNAFEVGFFGVPADLRRSKIAAFQGKLAKMLASKGSSISVPSDGSFGPATRAAIQEARRFEPRWGTGDHVDPNLNALIQRF